jgi:isoquinoline 1-oxidoreductase subunit beta
VPRAAYNPSRRRFLIAGATIAGGLTVGLALDSLTDRLGDPTLVPVRDGQLALNAWLKIDRHGVVTVMVPRAEMGQGTHTALSMLVAEELDADWSRVRVENAPVERVYGNVAIIQSSLGTPAETDGLLLHLARAGLGKFAALVGVQVTGGSSSVRDAWTPMRIAGATARAMLVNVAAERWNLLPTQLITRNGGVEFPPEKRIADFGTLVAAAAEAGLPTDVRLKARADWRLIGNSPPRVDAVAKGNGAAIFGLDVRAPELLYAAVRQLGLPGDKVSVADTRNALSNPGVKKIVPIASGVAVVADSFWRASKAAQSIQLKLQSAANFDDVSLDAAIDTALSAAEATSYEARGDAMTVLGDGTETHAALYRVPYLAHACMEPMNCTVKVTASACELWLGHQAPSLVTDAAADQLGLSEDAITLHQTFLGGGFGRRVELDVVGIAIEVGRAMPGQTVQVIWSREEDIQHDMYRPAAAAQMRGAIAADGLPVALYHRLTSSSVVRSFMSRLNASLAPETEEPANAEGMSARPYAIEHVSIEHVPLELPVPVGFWRSIGFSQNGFFYEAFLDELAGLAGRDPFAYRQDLLRSQPRHLRVLNTAARAAGWEPNSSAPKGFGRGIALVESFGSIVAQVLELELVAPDAVKLLRVICAIDCGTVVHPDQVRAQMESSITFGLSAALFGKINFQAGQVQQSNFHDYPVMRMQQMPQIDVLIVDSIAEPGGVGEPGTPPIAPALVNALYSATGKRFRELPLIGEHLRLVSDH